MSTQIQISAKTYLYKINNKSRYFVTVQSSSDTANEIGYSEPPEWTNLKKMQYTLRPKQLIKSLKNFVIPSVDQGEKIVVTVSGVNRAPVSTNEATEITTGETPVAATGPFVVNTASLYEQNGKIILVPKKGDTIELPLNKNRALTIEDTADQNEIIFILR